MHLLVLLIESKPNTKLRRSPKRRKAKFNTFCKQSIGIKRTTRDSIYLKVYFASAVAIKTPFLYCRLLSMKSLLKSDTSLLSARHSHPLIIMCRLLFTLISAKRVMLYFSNQFSIHMRFRVFTHLLCYRRLFSKETFSDIVSPLLIHFKIFFVHIVTSCIIRALWWPDAILMLMFILLFPSTCEHLLLHRIFYGLLRCYF